MMAAKGRLHMIGHAHLDPVWLWQWQEGFQETKATFRSALDRMQEYDDFQFISSSAAFYEWVEQSDPEMFAEIRERVAEGRWCLVGGWWIEPDCNVPSGESFVRQGLYGQRYFQSRFGRRAKVGFNPDSFGHNAVLPQILKKSGLDSYIFMRPMPNEKGLPGRLFWWEADDGSKVLTYRIPYEYLTWGQDVEHHLRRCAAELKAPINDLMCFYGVGNHGGGPTKDNIDSIHKWQHDDSLPELIMTNPETYFEELKQQELDLPVVHDDLQHHASGCYAAHSGIKMWNRKAEQALGTAEKVSTLANWALGAPYGKGFEQAWKNVLFNQFHDILAGTSLESAYDDAQWMYGEAMSIAARNLNYGMQAFSWAIDIPEEDQMKPLVVFNPHSWAAQVPVEIEVGGLKDQAALFTDDEVEIPFQRTQSQATCRGRSRICFVADLPPMGYRVYKLRFGREAAPFDNMAAGETWLENAQYRLEVDPETGYISQLLDKGLDYQVFQGPAARPVVIDDKSDTWSHNILRFQDEVGQFRAVVVKLVEQGPVRSILRVRSEYGLSSMVQDFVMYQGRSQIDVRVTVDWREQFKMLKLRFPVNQVFQRATYEIPYGSLERPVNGDEQPGGAWLDVSGVTEGRKDRVGVALLNDSKYSFDVLNKEMSITVLRSPVYANHDPMVPDPDGHYSFIDQGIQRFNYAILPHRGSWEEAGVVQLAAELNQKPIALWETYHKGSLPQQNSYLQVDTDHVVVGALKQAEDSEDMILRCYETAKVAVDTVITLPHWQRTIAASFGPAEIKTFRIPKDPDKPVVETSMSED